MQTLFGVRSLIVGTYYYHHQQPSFIAITKTFPLSNEAQVILIQ